MDPDLDDWDPMLEAYISGKKYERGPGADLHFRKYENEEGIKIFLTNLPSGITEEGIKNMCLSAGTPVSVSVVKSGEYAFIKFKTMREAELAIRDLNNTPPYFLRATFSRGKGVNKKSFANVEKDTKEGNKQEKEEEKLFKVSPYFSAHSDYRNPSIVMRQKILDFKTNKECVSMGRGYINIGDINRHKCENRIFSSKSKDWVENNDTINCDKCDGCGSLTFKKYKGFCKNYCSILCEANVASKCIGNSKSTIFDFFTAGCCGSLDFYNEYQGVLTKCCVLLDEESDRYKQLMNYDSLSVEIISAKRGDRVLVCNERGRFLRGVVLNDHKHLYSVALIDYGEIISVKEVYSLPNDLAELPTLGGTATFLTDSLPQLDPVEFRVKEKKAFGSWLCEVIRNNNIFCEILLEEWIGTIEPSCIPLESGCSVVITFFEDMKTVFVRRTDGSWDEEFIRLSNDIATYTLEAKKYESLPKIGEICGALYKNGCFHRAVVQSVERDSVLVKFMDYGNEQEIELDDLRYLPDVVRKINCFAVRVQLKNVPEKSSAESVEYFNQLTAYGKVLRLAWSNTEVILTDETNGDVVNNVVANMLVPIWEKDSSVFLKSGETFFLDSLDDLSFHPGETENIFLLNFDTNEFVTSGVFWATQNRADYLGHLNGELKQAMTEYFNYLLDNPYRPRFGELCLVRFEDDIYRGVLLDDKTSPYKVFLIDLGISTSVETKNMRKILKEFLELPALALQCRISGFDKVDKENLQKIMEYLMKMNKQCLENVKIMRNIDGVYEISVPFVNQLLG